MKYSKLSYSFLLLTSALAIYPPPANIDTNDPDLVTIQNSSPKDKGLMNTVEGYSDNNINSNTLKDGLTSTVTSTLNDPAPSDNSETLSPFYSFYLSISMIIVSEIGDKTFLIAAIMAMRHPRMIVFSAASSALILMTVLSGAIGHILPQLLSPRLTRSAAAILFIVFGFNLLREGLSVDKNQGVEEELAEVEEEIAAVELNELSLDIEKGNNNNSNNITTINDQSKNNNDSIIIEKKLTWKKRLGNLISYISSPIWFQTFSMTFLGEWGDRSQITTIAMAAGGDWIMIVLGGCIGHALCTLLAVVAGQFVSTKISLRTILLGGAFAFFIFSGLYGYSAVYE